MVLPGSGAKRAPAFALGASIALGVALLLAGGCGRERSASSYPAAPIVLISIDTLRSDHLPAYGYAGVETPALSRLAGEAILFEHAYSHYPLTYPSHSSILTGLLPSEHGVRDNVGYPLKSDTLPYLPRELKAAGYATGGAISAFVLQGASGLERSFDVYDDAIEVRPDVPLGGLQRAGSETLDRIVPWLDGAAAGPFFLFFHIYEPHTPYTPPEPFASRYPSAYDGEIAAADAIVGRLFEELRRLGVYDRAIIVLLSDHGEGLGEHGEDEHGLFLYRESLQVPLLLKLPGGARGGERVSAPAQLIDVAPTLLGLVGRPVPAGLHGASLLTLGQGSGARQIYAETYYPRLHMGWNDLASLIGGGYHYIEGPDPELYHLERDPRESSNVLGQERRTFAALRDAIRALRTPLAKPGEVDPETVAKLSALGYAGRPAQVAEGPLPDPKARIHTLADLKQASFLMSRKDFDGALPRLERLLAENPHMQDGWEKLALCFQRLGRRAEAVAAYKRALENSGGSPHVALALATLLSDLGRFQEAKAHAELALTGSPALAHQRLAEVALAAEDYAEAERQARAAVEAEADRPASLIVLAQVLSRLGKLDESAAAVARLDKLTSEARATPPHGYFLVRGDLLARQGHAAEAEAAFREEVRRHPESLESYSRLAVLQVAQGQAPAAWKTLQQMVETNDNSPASYVSAVETLRVLGDRPTAARLLAHARSRYPRDERLASLSPS